MKIIELNVTEKVKVAKIGEFARFLQKLLNRFVIGHIRYGAPQVEKCYLTKLSKELYAYKSTGNAEHLLNVAVYCFLEIVAPEHLTPHFNPLEKSATRKKKLI